MHRPQPLLPTDKSPHIQHITVDEKSSPPVSPHLVQRAQKRRSVLYDAAFPSSSNRLVRKAQWRSIYVQWPWVTTNIVLLVSLAIVFEVLLKVNHDHYGWAIPRFFRDHSQIHLLWTVLPGLFVWLVCMPWKGLDQNLKLLQPYVDMNSGQAPAHKSVLLNYNSRNVLAVVPDIVRNRHYTLLLTNMAVLGTVVLSPFTSGLFYSSIPSDSFVKPISNISVSEQLGFQNPVPYAGVDAAAGFIKAASRFAISPPPFIRFLPAAAWTSTRVAISNLKVDGTVKAHTVCLKSLVFCVKATSVTYDQATTTISGSTGNCTFQLNFNDSQGRYENPSFGISPAICPSAAAPPGVDTSSVVFWTMLNSTLTPVATVCTPSIQLQRADVLLNTTTSALLLVNNQSTLLPGDNNAINTLTAPYNGSAFNGLFFSNVPDIHSQTHLNSTRYSVGHTAMITFFNNDTTLSNADIYRQIVADTYAHFLGLAAQLLYFQPVSGQSTEGFMHLNVERIFVSNVAAHVLAAIFFAIAIVGAVILFLHHRADRRLDLTSEPGTIAAAVALAGTSELPQLLESKDTTEEMKAMLSDLNFGIDPQTGRLYVDEADGGYDAIPHKYDLEQRSPRLQKSFHIPSAKKINFNRPFTIPESLDEKTSVPTTQLPILDVEQRASPTYPGKIAGDSSSSLLHGEALPVGHKGSSNTTTKWEGGDDSDEK